MSSRENMVVSERKMGQGHVSDLYREAEVDRLLRSDRAPRRGMQLDLRPAAAWLGTRLQLVRASLRRRFISPCGEFTLLPVRSDC